MALFYPEMFIRIDRTQIFLPKIWQSKAKFKLLGLGEVFDIMLSSCAGFFHLIDEANLDLKRKNKSRQFKEKIIIPTFKPKCDKSWVYCYLKVGLAINYVQFLLNFKGVVYFPEICVPTYLVPKAKFVLLLPIQVWMLDMTAFRSLHFMNHSNRLSFC